MRFATLRIRMAGGGTRYGGLQVLSRLQELAALQKLASEREVGALILRVTLERR